MADFTNAVTRAGTTIQETAVPKVVSRFNEVSFPGDKLAHAHLDERSFSLNTLVNKENLVANYQWLPAATALTPIALLSIPNDLLTTNTISAPFNVCTYARFDVRVRVQISGIRTCQGSLIVAYMPLTSKNAFSSVVSSTNTCWASSVSSLSACQHAIMRASGPDACELEINFTHPRGYLRIAYDDVTDFLGTLGIFVLTKLKTGTGGPAFIPINVYADIVNPGFYIPLSSNAALTTIGHSLDQGEKVNRHRFSRKMRTTYEEEMRGEVQMEALGKVFGFAQRYLPSVISAGKELSQNLDKPADTSQPKPFVRRAVGQLTPGLGCDITERFDLHPGSQNIVLPEHFGSHSSQMDILDIIKVPVVYYVGNWKVADAYNTQLAGGPVCPHARGLDSSLGVYSTFSPTYLDYCALPFRYWRGGIKITIQVFGTGFHAGKLLLAFHAGVNSIPAGMPASAAQYCVNIDLNSENQTFDMVIPFRSPTPWLCVPNGSGCVNEQDLSFFDFATGMWSLRVVNPLVNAGDTADNVDFLVWVSADVDFEFNGMFGHNASVAPFKDIAWTAPPSEELEGEVQMLKTPAQASAVETVDVKADVSSSASARDQVQEQTEQQMEAPTSIVLGMDPGKTYGDWHFGNHRAHMNIKNLCRRYVKVFGDSVTMMTAAFNLQGQTPKTFTSVQFQLMRVGPNAENANQKLTIAGASGPGTLADPIEANGGITKGIISHFANIHRLWRGSTNYRITITQGYVQSSPTGQILRPFAMFMPKIINKSFLPITSPTAVTPFINPQSVNDPNLDVGVLQFIQRALGDDLAENVNFMNVNNIESNFAHVSAPCVVGDPGASYIDLQVPFWTHNHSRMCGLDTTCLNMNRGGTQVESMPAGFDNSVGTLIFGFLGTSSDVTITCGGPYNIQVFQSMGDDFAMGVRLPPPPLMAVQGYSYGATGPIYALYPDQYPLHAFMSESEARKHCDPSVRRWAELEESDK